MIFTRFTIFIHTFLIQTYRKRANEYCRAVGASNLTIDELEAMFWFLVKTLFPEEAKDKVSLG